MSDPSGRQAYVVKHALRIREACDPPHCSVCDLRKITPGVMEFLGSQIFHRKSSPSELTGLNTWFCPVCGHLDTTSGSQSVVENLAELLYSPPRCGYPLTQGGVVKTVHKTPEPMRQVGRRRQQSGGYFQDFRCRACRHRAQVLMRERSRPFVFGRGREMADGAMWHVHEVASHPVTGCSCRSRPLLSGARFEVAGRQLLLSICAGCHGISYVLDPSEGLGIEELFELWRRS